MMNCDRRDFLRLAVLTGAGGPLACCPAAVASGESPVSANSMGVLVDLTKCNGCRRCEAACREVHGFPVPTQEDLKDRSIFLHHRHPGRRDYTVVNEFHNGTTREDRFPVYVKSNCLHCLDPACASACLVGALRKQPDGAVTYDASKCMGCRYCMVVCPFQIPAYEYENVFTPQVRKCDFCAAHRASNGGGAPACVQACPKECLTFATRAELLERAHARIAERPEVYVDHVYGEHEAGGTAWLYLSGVPFESLAFPAVGPGGPPRLSESIQHGVFAYFMPPIAWCGILGLTMWLTRTQDKALSEHSTADADAGSLTAIPIIDGKESRLA
jgi:Fe-S-cluster-containing dehydrogenase component